MARLDSITIPLLENLATFLNRPQIMSPDLIEINSGLWDLRRFTEGKLFHSFCSTFESFPAFESDTRICTEDFTAQGYHRPYPEDSPIPYTMMGVGREVAWEKEVRKAIKLVARRFKGKDGRIRSGPTIIWRTLHHPPRSETWLAFVPSVD